MKKLLILIVITLIATINLNAAKNKYAFGGSIDKSLAVISIERFGESNSPDLIEGTFSFFGNGVFKVNRNTYANFAIGFTSYSYNTADYPGYSSSSTDIKLLGLTYFDKPDDFTPYIGYGGIISFVSSTYPEDLLNENFIYPQLSEILFAFDGKFGFNIPLNENLTVDVGLELKFYLNEYISLVPSLNAGVVYWLD